MSAQECVRLFPSDQIPGILNVLLDCTSTLQKLTETEREDDLSDRLMYHLRHDSWMRSAPFTLAREFRVYGDCIYEAGHSGRIDICFICAGGDQTYFAIEAKNLHVTYPSGWKSRIAEYVTGDQGMMCFVTSKYSSMQQAGAMLGYVFDGQTSKARKGISRAIDANSSKLKVSGKCELIPSNIVERVDETRHQFDKRPFTIYHLLVPVNTGLLQHRATVSRT